nr:DnaB-like helicase N-terminal domain-containing protein [Nocardioides sp. CGMCC 1.13656]
MGQDEPPFDPRFDHPADTRQPPQDMAAEQSCLGAMLISPQAIDDVTAVILPSDYYRPHHETIHNAIVDLHHRGEPVDMVTVAVELQRRGELQRVGGAPYLHTLAAQVPVAANASAYAASVLEKAKLRGIVTVGTRMVQLGHAGNLDAAQSHIADAVDLIEDTAMRFGNTSTTSTGLKDLSWILGGQPPVIPPPTICRRTDGTALFYPGKVNGIFGDPEAAKTWLAQAAGVEAMNAGGTLAMIDVDHNGPDHTAARLLLLGARLEHVADPNRFRYYEPDDPDELRAAVTDIVRFAPTVTIIDSLGEVFPMLGVNTNDGDEMTTAMRLVCTQPAQAGSCVITIDHLPKSTEARATGYAIGSIAKKRMIRGSYLRAEARQQPAPGHVGRITLRIEKDTAGELRKSSGGGYAGTFTLDSTQPHVTTWHVGREETPTNDDGTFRPTHVMERISRYVEENDQCTFTDIKDAITAKDKILRHAITTLVAEGFISRIQGPRRAQLHHSIALYRETEDDHVQQPD